MTAGWLVRDGTPDDGESILQVHRRSILTLGRSHYSEAECQSWAAGLETERYGWAMTEGGERFLVATNRGGRVVAFCSFKDDEVVGLYVDPDWARQGIGRDLLRRTEGRLIADSHTTIRVGASLSGRAFYESRGYRVVKFKRWATRGGIEIDIVEMEKSTR